MFGTKLYYYGSDSANKIRLRPAEADAVNKIRISDLDLETGYCRVNLNRQEMRDYDSAATKLNKYLESHTVVYTDEDIEAGIPVLRPVK